MSDREREGDTVYWERGEACLTSEDQRCDCCDIPLMSPVMCDQGQGGSARCHYTVLSWTL